MPFQVAVVQFKPVRKDVFKNILKIQSLLIGMQADLIVLPELSNSGYLYETPIDLHPYSEPNDGSGIFLSSMQMLAKSTGAAIVTGYSELDQDQIFNSAADVSPDGIIANYRKTHLYLDEKSLFQPGDCGFKVFTWKGVRIGMMICFDWIFPEAARTLALDGAQILAHPANLVLPYCQDAMITRSIENKLFTITANRIGKERLGKSRLRFTGQSQITTPKGEVLFRGPKTNAKVHVEKIAPEKALDKAISFRNDLFEDRRSDLYRL